MLAQAGRLTWLFSYLFIYLILSLQLWDVTSLSKTICHKDFRVNICISIYWKWWHLLNWWTLYDWQADDPEINYKGHYAEEFRQQFPTAPAIVSWVSGVISWTCSTHFIFGTITTSKRGSTTRKLSVFSYDVLNPQPFGMLQRCSSCLVAFTWGSQCQHVTSN